MRIVRKGSYLWCLVNTNIDQLLKAARYLIFSPSCSIEEEICIQQGLLVYSLGEETRRDWSGAEVLVDTVGAAEFA